MNRALSGEAVELLRLWSRGPCRWCQQDTETRIYRIGGSNKTIKVLNLCAACSTYIAAETYKTGHHLKLLQS